MSELINGQEVKVNSDHNQFKACSKTKYKVGAINKVPGTGDYSIMLLLNGNVVGAIPERKLSANR